MSVCTAAPMYFKPLELTTGGNERRATTSSSNRRASALRSNNTAKKSSQIEQLEDGGLGTYFYCVDDNCPGEVQREIEEVKFGAHLKNEHGIIGAEVEAALRRSKGPWVYRRGC
ncbi:hypothetical protein PC116_g31031 [Phytophthora cactorum]|nr:hypothetical protein PC116_g31031 [Phytophthora cactorum]